MKAEAVAAEFYEPEHSWKYWERRTVTYVEAQDPGPCRTELELTHPGTARGAAESWTARARNFRGGTIRYLLQRTLSRRSL